MTKDKALKLGLEALETPWNAPYVDGCDLALGKKVKAITAIKEALANEALEKMAENARELGLDYEPEQEPVAWRAKNFYENQEGWFYAEWHQDGLTPQVAELLYTTPPQRTWVGLTRMELIKCGVLPYGMSYELYEAIEQALKERNT